MSPFLIGLMLFITGIVLLGIPWKSETTEGLSENPTLPTLPTTTDSASQVPPPSLPAAWDLDLITSQERPSQISSDMVKLLTSPFVLDLSTLSKDYIREEITELPEDSYDMEDKLRYKGVLFSKKDLPLEQEEEDDETQRVRGVVRQVMNDPAWQPVITKTAPHTYEVNEILPVGD